MRTFLALLILHTSVLIGSGYAQDVDGKALIKILRSATDGYDVAKESRAFASVRGVEAMRARVEIFDHKLQIKGGPNLRDWLFTGMQKAENVEATLVLAQAAANKKHSTLLRLVCLRSLRHCQAEVAAMPLLAKSLRKTEGELHREWQRTLGALLGQNRLILDNTKGGAEEIRAQLMKAGAPYLGMASLPELRAQEAAAILTAVRKSKNSGDLAQMVHVLANFSQQAYAHYLNAIQVALSRDECGPRIAAVESAVHHRIYEAIPFLIKALGQEEGHRGGRYSKDYAWGLRALSGQQFGPQSKNWQRWWSQSGDSWVAQIRSGEIAAPGHGSANSQNQQQTIAEVFGIPVDSKRIGIVLDGSGSMNDVFDHRSCGQAAADELEKFLAKLPPDSKLQLSVIVKQAERCFKRTVPANAKNRQKAIKFVRRFPFGPASAMYDVLLEAQTDPEIDTIVFISDGGGSWGSFAYPGHMLEGLSFAHQRSGVRIHAICVGKSANKARFMEQMADMTRGRMRQPSG